MSEKQPPETADDLWENYITKVLPGIDPESIQYIQTRQAFYAGMLSLFTWIMKFDDDEGEDAVERDGESMTKLYDEVTKEIGLMVMASFARSMSAAGNKETPH